MRRKEPSDPENSASLGDAPPVDKPLYVLHGEIKTPPMSNRARVDTGFHLRSLQQGTSLAMPLSRPMPGIGANCHELRIGDIERDVEWRIVYCIDEAAIVVLEIFEKKTRATPERIMQSCRQRLHRYLAAKEKTEES